MLLTKLPFTATFQWISLSIIIVLIIFKFVKRIQFVNSLNQIPGPKAYPLVGNIFSLIGKDTTAFFEYVQNLSATYKDIFVIWLGPYPKVYLSNPNDSQVVLSSIEYIQKSDEYSLLDGWLGTGLITSTGQKWHQRRKILTPAFHYNIIETMLEPIQINVDKFVNRLKDKVDGEEFDVFPYSKLVALDIICATIMGYDLRSQENINSGYTSAVKRVTEIVMQKIMFPWLQYDFIFNRTSTSKIYEEDLKTIHDFTMNVIKERRDFIKNKKVAQTPIQEDSLKSRKNPTAFLDLCLQLPDMTDDDVREEVDTFMFAGHDTMSGTISWTLYNLGHHPEMQEKIIQEAESVGFYDDNLSIPTLGKLEYLERCIKESLRLYPPVPVIGRELMVPLKTTNYTVGAGAAVFINVFEQHRKAEYFPNPLEYDPDRFLTKTKHPFAYVPFSAGPRNCIGQKVAMLGQKMIIAHVLKKYVISSVVKPENLKLVQNIVLESNGGIKITIKER